MAVKVLVVDDSAVIRGLVSKALATDQRIKVAGTASNGKVAIDMTRSLQPDVIILDIEMPVMDGLQALPEILQAYPHTKVIMSSTLTQRNADISLQAMAKGAADYIGKPSAKYGNEVDAFYSELVRKVKALGGLSAEDAPVLKKDVGTAIHSAVTPALPAPKMVEPAAVLNPMGIHALAIASSTGGPQALMTLFSDLNGTLKNIPVFITQHMPPTFTRILAEHIAKTSGRPCTEAMEGEPVKAGHTYLAPGDYHMMVEKAAAGGLVIRLNQGEPENYCRPAADPMLRSLSKVYGHHLAALVLTGMGQDGMLGCKEVVQHGGSVVAQDAATSVVYGMPKAVAEQNLCKAILPLPKIGRYLIEQIDGKR